MTFPNVPLTTPQWTNGEELNAAKMQARIDTPLNQIQSFLSSVPLGIIGFNALAFTNNYTTNVSYVSVTCSFVAGRTYRLTGGFEGTNLGATAAPQLSIVGSTIPFALLWFLTVGAGVTIYGLASVIFQPLTTASFPVGCQITNFTGNNVNINGGAYILVEDTG